MKLIRIYDDGKTILGELQIGDKTYYTCELSWNNNKKRKSCIPHGIYEIEPHISPKFKECLKINNVPNRSNILIHQGNTHLDTKGCILIGKELRKKIFVKNNYYVGVIKSRIAKKEILELIKEKTKIEIINCDYKVQFLSKKTKWYKLIAISIKQKINTLLLTIRQINTNFF